jgi:hypothetical protein
MRRISAQPPAELNPSLEFSTTSITISDAKSNTLISLHFVENHPLLFRMLAGFFEGGTSLEVGGGAPGYAPCAPPPAPRRAALGVSVAFVDRASMARGGRKNGKKWLGL